MSKIIVYILGLVGVAGIAISSIPQLAPMLPLPEKIANIPSDIVVVAISLALVLISLMMITKGGSGKQPKEVPIYRGKNIVGFRQIK